MKKISAFLILFYLLFIRVTFASDLNDLNKVLPSLPFDLEKVSVHFDSNSKDKGSTTDLSQDNSDISLNNKCTASLPCLPMYNRYVMQLDAEDPELLNVQRVSIEEDLTTHTSDNLKKVADTLTEIDDIKPQMPVIPDNLAFKVLKFDKQETEDLIINKVNISHPLSEMDYLLEQVRAQGVILTPVIKNNQNDEELNKLLSENPADETTDELLERKQKLMHILGVTGDFLRGYSEAEDKAEYLKNVSLAKANGIIDNQINEFLKAYDGVNAELALRLDFNNNKFSVKPEGKILFPLYSVPELFVYAQGGITTGTNNRRIAHLGLGQRFYPEALSMDDLGHHMFGMNVVFDKDLSRGHLRGSIGFEYMYDNLKLISNIYRRLSGWKDSPDFEKGYVEERPASGWDFIFEYWYKSKFAFTGSVTHWIGKDISPFGDTAEENLEDSPYVYSLGLKYNPVPALSLELKHERTNHSAKNTVLGVNFNIPFDGNFDFYNAFDPEVTNKASGSNIMTSRSMFIQRDYTMPLQYRSKPGKYYIEFMYQPSANKYLFIVKDGFKRPAPNVPVTVKPSHPSVVLSNGGNYVTDNNGMFVVEVLHSVVPKDTLTVCAGSVCLNFEIEIQILDWKIKASLEKFERYETSTVTVYIDSTSYDGITGMNVEWYLENGALGKLEDKESHIDSYGRAKVVYHPDTTIDHNYDVVVVAKINNVEYKIKLYVVVYGNGNDDFTITPKEIDGGNYAVVEYKNLKPDSIVELTATGVCQLVLEKPEEPLEMTGTDNNGQTVKAHVDENGVAVAYAVGSTVVGDTGKCVIKTKTPDKYFDSVAPADELVSSVYDAYYTLPPSVLYLEPFTVTLNGLKNDTNVRFSIENDSADLSFSKMLKGRASVLLLAEHPNNDRATKDVTVVETKASTDYLVTGDYSVTDVSGIHAKYYHDAVHTNVDIGAEVLAINQYTPVFEVPAESLEKLKVFSGNDEITVYLTEGQPYRNVFINNAENNVIIEADPAFDVNGRAKVIIKGKDIRENQPFSIVASAMGKEIDLKRFTASVPLTYHLYTPEIVKSTDNTGNEYSGLPSYSGQTNVIDYDRDYLIEITNLLPNSKVTISGSNVNATLPNAIVNADGKIFVKLSQVHSFNITNVSFTINVLKSSVESSVTAYKYDLNLNQYLITLTSDTNAIISKGKALITASGGKAGYTCKFEITGDGKLLQSLVEFDNEGKAMTTIQGKSSYSNDITVTATMLVE